MVLAVSNVGIIHFWFHEVYQILCADCMLFWTLELTESITLESPEVKACSDYTGPESYLPCPHCPRALLMYGATCPEIKTWCFLRPRYSVVVPPDLREEINLTFCFVLYCHIYQYRHAMFSFEFLTFDCQVYGLKPSPHWSWYNTY